MSDDNFLVRAPLFPTYAQLKGAVATLDSEPVALVRKMIDEIFAQTGTPQNPVTWTDPDQWIPERLNGESQRIADKIWNGTSGILNPRYLYGAYLLINRVSLLDQSAGKFVSTERSRRLLADDSALIQELDIGEGIPKILSLLAPSDGVKISEIVQDWGDYLLAVSKFSTKKVFNDTLRRRLVNLIERDLVARTGNKYALTKSGRGYLKKLPHSNLTDEDSSKRTSVYKAAKAHNDAQLTAFKKRLMELEPYQFEFFIKALLEAMDYENVVVTKQSGDKGVDVVANYQFGITEITEVVQVKRTESTITRPVIDQLRGALPYHGAIRGTIVTLGKFAKGVSESALHQGAAPITLIDGQRLLELAVKHEVGLKTKKIALLQLDDAFFDEHFINGGIEKLTT